MTDASLALVPQNAMPVISIEHAVQRYNAIVDFTKTVMQKDKDFGVIPGTGNKPTLYKPGAEKLCTLFGLHPVFTSISQITDWDKGFFYFQYRCDLLKGGEVVASGIGSCNSKEVKYRYRQSTRVCPNCGKATIIKGKAEYGGGWLCFAKKGGCGAKFQAGDQAIEGQAQGQIENTEPFDLVNTLDKMAQKRAFVAATLIGANASEFFTQDIEDIAFIDGESHIIQEETGGNGHKAEEVKPAKLPTLKQCQDRWAQLWAWKTALGFQYEALPASATVEQYIERGKDLHAALVRAAGNILPADMEWDDSDATIKAAVDQMGAK